MTTIRKTKKTDPASLVRAELSDVAGRIARLDSHVETMYDERAYWWAVLLVGGELRADVAYMSGQLNKETLAYALRVRVERFDADRRAQLRGRPLPELAAAYLELLAKHLVESGASAGTLGFDVFDGDMEHARRKCEALADRIEQTEQRRRALAEQRNALFLRGLDVDMTGVELANLGRVTSMVVSNVKKERTQQ